MDENWLWIGKYVIVIVAALILGAVLGGIDPFREATVGGSHLSAGALVQFIAHTGALVMLWALGLRHSSQLRRGASRSAHLATSVLALVSLVVIACFYGVLFHFVGPFLVADSKPILDWSFIGAILATSAWLLWALFSDSDAFLSALGKDRTSSKGARGAA